MAHEKQHHLQSLWATLCVCVCNTKVPSAYFQTVWTKIANNVFTSWDTFVVDTHTHTTNFGSCHAFSLSFFARTDNKSVRTATFLEPEPRLSSSWQYKQHQIRRVFSCQADGWYWASHLWCTALLQWTASHLKDPNSLVIVGCSPHRDL